MLSSLWDELVWDKARLQYENGYCDRHIFPFKGENASMTFAGRFVVDNIFCCNLLSMTRLADIQKIVEFLDDKMLSINPTLVYHQAW